MCAHQSVLSPAREPSGAFTIAFTAPMVVAAGVREARKGTMANFNGMVTEPPPVSTLCNTHTGTHSR